MIYMISGDFPWYRGLYSPDPQKLIDIKNWGTNAWNSFDGAFNGSSLDNRYGDRHTKFRERREY